MLAREELLVRSRDESDESLNVLAQPLVLVADDDADFRATLVKTLTRLSMRVMEVENGHALIAALGNGSAKSRVPDLVITDNHMPGCTGLTALAIMQESGFKIPVILMTGIRDSETQKCATRYGAIATLRKPFDIHELREIIERALTKE